MPALEFFLNEAASLSLQLYEKRDSGADVFLWVLQKTLLDALFSVHLLEQHWISLTTVPVAITYVPTLPFWMGGSSFERASAVTPFLPEISHFFKILSWMSDIYQFFKLNTLFTNLWKFWLLVTKVDVCVALCHYSHHEL